ncbi:neuronal PAS domain-containing protein 4-like isoform X3 [Carassius auratus]|uniref:Neuronal PAS domain-containing protein 4-like isoform X3 n=1 Tax=Carassius auratus TaxID=7957 RepID=A0A6P6QMK9_CARAU|nr:neuronal PAS domain-containing protein 4-like isoform X3 [Carassius auratus]
MSLCVFLHPRYKYRVTPGVVTAEACSSSGLRVRSQRLYKPRETPGSSDSQRSERMSVGCDTSVRRILRASQRFRSTKGASKARRDHINGEIRNMRSLLPISAEDQERLSYLHSMSLICTYVRKTVLLKGVQQRADGASPLYESFLQALPGFIVALTRDGKLVYVSENVPEYLGLSMVDVLQGDTFYDMMDSRDAEAVEVILREQAFSAERSFVCRMHTSKAFRLQYGSCCSMLVRGRFQAGPPDAALFVALCTPTVDRLKDSELLRSSACFQTLHRPDMRLTHAPYSVLFHLGFSAEELIGRSWYDLLHPDDLTLAAGCHRTLTAGAESAADGEMLVRLLCKDLSWIWLYVCVTVDRARELISCTNHVLSEAEALYLKDKLYGGVSSQRPVLSAPRPREREAVRRSSETSDCSGGTDADPRSGSLAFSTPPYSPTSSHSSDFLSDGYSGFEQLADGFCPSQAFCDPSCGVPPVCLPDAHLVPIYRPALDVCEAAADCVLHPEDFSVFPLPHEGDLLTPEASPTADGHFLYSERERAEIGTLAHQIRSLASSFDAYSTTRHLQPDSAPCWPPAPEPLLDETVIDSILRDLVSAKEPDCVWSRSAAGAFSACVYEHQR